MENLCSAYVNALMGYIQMEYDNIPSSVTTEMEVFFLDCFNEGRPACLPNAAGAFWERFLKTPENL